MISHLALIMDGNRRWAKRQNMFPWLGHRQGAKNVEMVVRYCLEKKIPYVSLYTFSLENFKRTEKEVSYLFSLIEEIKGRAQEFVDSGVKIRFVGEISQVPEKTQKTLREVEEQTKDCRSLVCNFLFCYGGQQEIVAAAQKLANQKEANISVDDFRTALWTGDIPDPEIIIRTGGVKRLSNFLLFQSAYSEIRFLDCLWPELTQQLLDQTIQDCLNAHKNFGK